ncbi:MAG: SRPBCC family protein [Holophaga sp.]|jgi:hypothetical protein
MWHAEHTLETTARPERIWAQMQAVATWPQWDTGLVAAELRGDFSAGAQGTMQFRSRGPRAFLLAAVAAPNAFTALVRLPLAELRHIHSQETSPMGTRLTHRIEIRGPLSWFYGLGLGRRLREGLAPGMRRLAQLAS